MVKKIKKKHEKGHGTWKTRRRKTKTEDYTKQLEQGDIGAELRKALANAGKDDTVATAQISNALEPLLAYLDTNFASLAEYLYEVGGRKRGGRRGLEGKGI